MPVYWELGCNSNRSAQSIPWETSDARINLESSFLGRATMQNVVKQDWTCDLFYRGNAATTLTRGIGILEPSYRAIERNPSKSFNLASRYKNFKVSKSRMRLVASQGYGGSFLWTVTGASCFLFLLDDIRGRATCHLVYKILSQREIDVSYFVWHKIVKSWIL